VLLKENKISPLPPSHTDRLLLLDQIIILGFDKPYLKEKEIFS
jgi:hypothetical protein